MRATKWMKFVLLVAGLLGALGFVRPLYRVGEVEVTPRELVSGVSDRGPMRDLLSHVLGLDRNDESSLRQLHIRKRITAERIYWLAPGVLVLVGVVAILIGRLGFIAGLLSVASAMLALGGWLSEYIWQRDQIRAGGDAYLASGASWLLACGVVSLGASIIALLWNDPGRPPKKRVIEIPQARLVT